MGINSPGMGDQYYTMETGARKQSTEHRVPLQVVKAVTKRDYPGSSLLDVLEKKEKETMKRRKRIKEGRRERRK